VHKNHVDLTSIPHKLQADCPKLTNWTIYGNTMQPCFVPFFAYMNLSGENQNICVCWTSTEQKLLYFMQLQLGYNNSLYAKQPFMIAEPSNSNCDAKQKSTFLHTYIKNFNFPRNDFLKVAMLIKHSNIGSKFMKLNLSCKHRKILN
jgi:hypothetical protein